MADVTIDASVGPDPEFEGLNLGPHWKTDQIGYRFGIDSNLDAVYWKTADGGQTWAAAVTVLTTGESTDGYIGVTCWFDKETTGDSGTLIHVWGQDQHSKRVRYRNLDISSDTLGTEVTVATVTNFRHGYSYSENNWFSKGPLSGTKAVGGNLAVAFWDCTVTGPPPTLVWKFYRSTDGGATWSSKDASWGLTTSTQDTQLQLLPASDTDTQDLAVITLSDDFGVGTAALSVWLYDDSANSWGHQTSIVTLNSAGGDWADMVWFGDVALRHSDGKAILVAFKYSDYSSPATNELYVYELTLTAAAIAATAKTSVITATANAMGSAIHIDQATNNLRAMYIKGGTWFSSTDVYYKLSTDGGSTWGAETKLNTTAHNIQHVTAGHSVKSGSSGRFMPSWADIGNLDILTNYGTSVAFTVASAVSDVPPVVTASQRINRNTLLRL
jgi:hypothetical protein